MQWPEFLLHYLSKYRPSDIRPTAAMLRQRIGRHYTQTAHPIVEDAPHPLTGVSWGWLLAIAMRGDFKQRKQPGSRVHLQIMAPVRRRTRRDNHRRPVR
jgi:hypothetical protein